MSTKNLTAYVLWGNSESLLYNFNDNNKWKKKKKKKTTLVSHLKF